MDHGSSNTPEQITALLSSASGGDPSAARDLLPLLYQELRALAHARIASEPSAGAGQTLQPTALVHEVYLRLIGPGDVSWKSRGHFFAAAALSMRRILVERARARKALKRGGRQARVDFNEQSLAAEPEPEDLLALDEVLQRLESEDPRKAEVVSMRVFAGLTVEQTALALDVSEVTVKRDWAFARAWLRRELESSFGGAAQ